MQKWKKLVKRINTNVKWVIPYISKRILSQTKELYRQMIVKLKGKYFIFQKE